MQRDTLPFTDFGVPMHALAMPYLGRVTDVNDPENLARVKVELYALDTDANVALWARVASPFAGARRGGFFIPQEDDEVLVLFVGGDARHPVVVGGLWNGTATPPETLNGRVDRWSITGKAGTRIAIVEESDATATIECSTPGGVQLTMTDEAGGKVTIECAGNTVTIEPAGITVQSPAKVKVQATTVEVSAATVKVDAAMSTFTGVVKCDTLISNAVVSTSYTPARATSGEARMTATTLETRPQSPPRPLALRVPTAQAHGPAHPVRLSGLRAGPQQPAVAPLIVERRDQDFVEGLLADLGDASAHAALRASVPARQQGVPRLFPPVQRVFNLVVMEAFCDQPGRPRLDPAQIESSGFVLRRVVGAHKQAWLKAGTQVFGWEAVDESLDPVQDRRGLAVDLGHPVLNALAPSQRAVRTAGSARLASARVAVSEDVQPLFKTPRPWPTASRAPCCLATCA